MTNSGQRKLKVFISYAHEDDELREKLDAHLAQLRRDGLIEEWHDRQLTGGQEWAGQIDAQLEKADIVLLLVSSDFINSDYCADKRFRGTGLNFALSFFCVSTAKANRFT